MGSAALLSEQGKLKRGGWQVRETLGEQGGPCSQLSLGSLGGLRFALAPVCPAARPELSLWHPGSASKCEQALLEADVQESEGHAGCTEVSVGAGQPEALLRMQAEVAARAAC